MTGRPAASGSVFGPDALLVNRTRVTTSIKNELVADFNKLAERTRIPKSRLFDEAIEDLLAKYAKKDG